MTTGQRVKSKISTCLCCGSEGYSEQQHWPVPRRHGGVQTIPLCISCHDAADRLKLNEWELHNAADGFLSMWDQLSVDGRLLLMRVVAVFQDIADHNADENSIEHIASKFVDALNSHEMDVRSQRSRTTKRTTARELSVLTKEVEETRLLVNRVLRHQDYLLDVMKEARGPVNLAEIMDRVFPSGRRWEKKGETP